MKKSLMLLLIVLVLTQSQILMAQTEKANLKSPDIEIRSDVTGMMVKKFKKKRHRGGYSQYTYNLNRFRFVDVNYDPQVREWRLFGEASDSGTGKVVTMWIRYQEWNSLLHISMTRERNIMWSIPQTDSIKVTIPEDKSSFRLDFLKTIQGQHPAGSHHFWVKDSWLLAPR